MRLGTIDCGTNTVLLLVADVARDRVPRARAVEERIEFARLGQDLDRTGVLREDAMERALLALQSHAARARELGAERVVAVGTESLRAAKNGAEFLARARALGVPLRVASGDDEARLSWRAVAGSLPLPAGQWRSVLDIGGGSTELIVGRAGPEAYRSVPIGSVRLTERLLHHDPPTPAERAELVEAIERGLDGLPAPRGELVGVAGTVTTLGAIHLGMAAYESSRIEGMRLSLGDLLGLVERLGSMPVAERRRLPGLDPRRADVIYAGAAIAAQVAQRAGVPELTISDRGVRWGVLEELIDELERAAALGPEAPQSPQSKEEPHS